MTNSPIAFAGAPLDLAENDRNAPELTAYSKAKSAKAVVYHEGKFLVGPDGHLADIHPQDLVGKHIFDPGPLFLGIDGKSPVLPFHQLNLKKLCGLAINYILKGYEAWLAA